jgi:hypothetical protein
MKSSSKLLPEAAVRRLALGACLALAIDATPVASHGSPSSARVLAIAPPAEGFGTVLVELVAAGPREVAASIRVEYDVLGDIPDAGWRLCKAVQDPEAREHGLRDMPLVPEGTPLAFFWDSEHDLAERDELVQLRMSARGKREGGWLESAPFRIEND